MRLRVFFVGLLASISGSGPAEAALGTEPAASTPPADSRLESEAQGLDDPARPFAVALRPRSSARLSEVRRILDSAREPSSDGLLLSPWDEVILSAYAEEISQSLGARAGESIARLITSLPARERTWVIARWALSGRDKLRLALARAAAHPVDAVGIYTALEHLARDPSPEIRDTAREALVRRGLQP